MHSQPQPLADLLRPRSLEEIEGQEHLLGPQGFITQTIKKGRALSILLFGPPGSGKTTLARLYAKAFETRFIPMSAVFSGVADIKKTIQEIKSTPLFGKSPILFVDEIHRFNKAQQDAFLPFMEDGTIVLVGATTENPSFSLNDALLSRMRTLTLHHLEEVHLENILRRYEQKFAPLPIDTEARAFLISAAQGDGRALLNLVESVQPDGSDKIVTQEELKNLLQRRPALYDRAGEGHYNLISALHKSIRGSDPDASLYWFARMLEGGEEPLFIARRLIRVATEDVGLADPQALQIAVSAKDAYEMLGSPEGELALAEAVLYLALAPKSNAVYTAYNEARKSAGQSSHLPPPSLILNAPTKLMKEMGYGKGYIYDHDTPDGISGQNYFPDQFAKTAFYQPVERGFEREMKKRVEYFNKFRAQGYSPDHNP